MGNHITCNSMTGPWGYYVKWNKSEIERQILYNLIFCGIKKQKQNKEVNLIEKEIIFVVTRRGRTEANEEHDANTAVRYIWKLLRE